MNMMRIAQVLLVVAAGALWGASRLTWVTVSSFDGLGQPKTTALTGAAWSTALVPLALLLLAAAVAALAVRGWPMRLLALLVAAASAGMGYLSVSLWMVVDVAVRAANLAHVPVAQLTGTERFWSCGRRPGVAPRPRGMPPRRHVGPSLRPTLRPMRPVSRCPSA